MTEIIAVFGAPSSVNAIWGLLEIEGNDPIGGAAGSYELTLECAPATPLDSDILAEWASTNMTAGSKVELAVLRKDEPGFVGRWVIRSVSEQHGPWFKMAVASDGEVIRPIVP